MRSGAVRKDRVLRAMRQLGFMETRRTGQHLILRHAETGLIVVIPLSRDEVPLVVLRGIERQMENYNIITRDRFRQML
jgi:predicted RNA binding protein YcfA (HicA-like mRNA interferase family)